MSSSAAQPRNNAMTLARNTALRSPRRLPALCLALLGLTIGLSACTPLSIAQQKWENRLDAASGVESASWTYRNNWPSSPSVYSAELRLSPELTEADAQEIARLSCEGKPRFDEVTVRTTSVDDAWDATMYGLDSSCFDPDQLTRFSKVLDALKAASPSLIGEVVISGTNPTTDSGLGGDATDAETTDSREAPRSSSALRLTAETASPETLFSLLHEIYTRTDDTSLEFEGSVDGDGSTITNFGVPITVKLPAGFDLDPALPVLERAYALNHRGITFTPEGMVFSPSTIAAITDPATLEVQAESERSGISFTVLSPDGAATSKEQGEAYSALTTAIAELPGISGVQLPSRSEGAETKVRANDEQAIAAALDLIASSEKISAEFYLEGPPDTLFVRVLRNSGQNPGMLEAYQQMLNAQQTIPHAGLVALIVSADSITMRFDLDDEASSTDISHARAELLGTLKGSSIDKVSLHPPYPEPWEDLAP